MSNDDYYREQAKDAEEFADRALSPVDKASWLRIAQGWMGLVTRPLGTPSQHFDDEVKKRRTGQDDSGASH